MLGIHDYWLFVLAGVLLNLTPGQDTFYILGASIAQGRRVGVASALGIASGCVVHTLAAAAGLSAILATSATAFIAVKLAGAAYLIYLGVRYIMMRDHDFALVSTAPSRDAWKAYRQGVVTNVLNPKVALFFLAFLPQFIAADEIYPLARMLELSGAFMLMTFVVFVLYGLFAALVRDRVVSRPQVMKWLRRAFAGGFALLGARLAFAER